MKQKLVPALLFLSLVGFCAGAILTNSILLGICTANDRVTDASCINLYERIGDPLFYGFGALSIVFLVLLFVPKAFSLWWKFAIWYVPLAALVFAFGEVNQGGWVKLLPDMEEIIQWMSMFYIVVSLFLIGYVFFVSRSR